MERAIAKIGIDSEIFSRSLIRQKAAAPTEDTTQALYIGAISSREAAFFG
jgi:hypothetical protein